MKRFLKFLPVVILLLTIGTAVDLQAEGVGAGVNAKANPALAGQADTCWADFDLDNNGLPFTVADFVYLIRLMGSCQDIPADIYRADLNGDCVIDSLDVNRADSLFKYGLGICDPLPCYPIPTCCNPEVRLNIICGDLNCSRQVDLLDITALVNYIYKGGTAPRPVQKADVNRSGSINIMDLTYLVSYLYKNGPAPNCP